VHTERRRVFWQRVYLVALDKGLESNPRNGDYVGNDARAQANLAVSHLDQWEQANGIQREDPDKAETGPDSDRPHDDADDGGYLGR
jgi:hypothetical protein